MAEAKEHAEHHAELEAKQQAEWAAARVVAADDAKAKETA